MRPSRRESPAARRATVHTAATPTRTETAPTSDSSSSGPFRIGLTGSVCAGKSEVGRLFEKWGAARIDADDLARQAVRRGSEALERIRSHWGDAALLPDGGLDREAMRRIVFADAKARSRLERVVHAGVARLRAQRLDELVGQGVAVVVEEIPLLFETGMEGDFGVVVVVDADRDLRRDLAVARGWTETDFDAVDAAQMDPNHKRSKADHVIMNEGSVEDLASAARHVWEAVGGAEIADRPMARHSQAGSPQPVEPPPPPRRQALEQIRDRLLAARRVVLTTHVNPDGDGYGSMAALARWLQGRGIGAAIVTPTPAPDYLSFLTEGIPEAHARAPEAEALLSEADTMVVLDTAERGRLGGLAPHAERLGGVVIDHHPPTGPDLMEIALRDSTACATGELIYDLIALDGGEITLKQAQALYIAIATDTGSFRFTNTTPRAHRIVAELLAAGVDLSEFYRVLYGTFSMGRMALTKLALGSLQSEGGIAWVALDHRALQRTGATWEDLEGLVDFPRRLQGIEVGVLFRALSHNRTKVSFRSNGPADVQEVAAGLGGGGHEKASGVLMEVGLSEAMRVVLARLRPVVNALSSSGESRAG